MRKLPGLVCLLLVACEEKPVATRPAPAPTPIAEVKLAEAKEHELYGRFEQALSLLDGIEDPRVKSVRERLEKKLATSRVEKGRRQSFARFSADAARLEIEASSADGVKKWQAVIDAFAGAEANAPTDLERAKARAGVTRAESRRDWAAAREAQAAGDDETAFVLAQKAAAAKDAPTALTAFAESLRAARETRLRKQAYDDFAEKARAEKDSVKALLLWRRAHEAADSSSDQLESLERIAALEDQVEREEDAELYRFRLQEAEAAMKAKDYGEAWRLYDAAWTFQRKGVEAREALDGLCILAPSIAYQGSITRGQTESFRKKWLWAKEAYQRALKAKPGDSAATRALERVQEQLEKK